MQMFSEGTIQLGILCPPPSTPSPSDPPFPPSQPPVHSSLLPAARCLGPSSPPSLSLGARSGLMGFRIASSKNAVRKLRSIKAAP